MRAGRYGPTLIGLLEEICRHQGALITQRSVRLFAETRHLLQSSDDEGDGGKLCFRVGHLLFEQAECLREEFVCHCLVVGEVDPVRCLSRLKVEPQCQVGTATLCLGERPDRLMHVLEDLCHFF